MRSSQKSEVRIQRGRGFTLYEVLLVMVLILVVAGIVAPSLTTFLPGLRVQKAADELVAAAAKARNDATLTLRRHRLVFRLDPPSYALAFEKDPVGVPGTFRQATGAWGEMTELPEGVLLEKLEGAAVDDETGESTYEFAPDGTATAGAIEIANAKGEKVKIVIDAATGKVAIEE